MSRSSPPDDELVAVGRIVKPHGIRGEVVVSPLTDREERFAPDSILWAAGRRFEVISSRPHQGRLLVRLAGIEERTPAERLRGTVLEAVRDELDEPDVYLADELVDLPVVGVDEAPLGRVTALIELPDAAGYDLLEITRDDGSTWLLPASEDLAVLDEVDGELRVVLTEAADGLLDELEGDRGR